MPYLPSLQHWTELHSIKHKVCNINLTTDKIIQELHHANDQQPSLALKAQIPTSFKGKVNNSCANTENSHTQGSQNNRQNKLHKQILFVQMIEV